MTQRQGPQKPAKQQQAKQQQPQRAQKKRLSATVESELLEAGRVAVAEGRAPHLSAWVNDALRRQADHDRRMVALSDFLAHYEAENGEITEQEMKDAARRARSRAVVVRGSGEDRAKTRRGTKRGAA